MTDARLFSRPAVRSEHKEHISANSELDTLPRAVQTAAGTPLWNLTPQQWRVFLLVGKLGVAADQPGPSLKTS